MERYGIDGFKFDSGDTYLYQEDDRTYKKQDASAHTREFNLFCKEFSFNEFRNVWDLGGCPVVCRLQDKAPRWKNDGLDILIPNMLTQGILGYYFGCPDMIGGGCGGYFADKNYKTDEELYLRWLAASVLCPMMQFSISPKRILSDESFKHVEKLVKIRDRYIDRIMELAKNAAKTGEPILRYMEYEFPGMGYERITDQFMLGDDILAAPIFEPGARDRDVLLPDGKWQDEKGNVYTGGSSYKMYAELWELIILKKI